MTDYIYDGIATKPNIATEVKNEEGKFVLVSGILFDINGSEMTNKDIQSCTWRENAQTLTIVWDGTLTTDDKTILDGIVANNE